MEKERKAQNFNNMKVAFQQSKEIIEKNNLEKSKEFFEIESIFKRIRGRKRQKS